MLVKRASDLEMQIEQLKDLKSIFYQDIYLGNTSGKERVLPGFLVFYGNGKELFLTVNDPFFASFVKRLREVYLEEKDRVLRESVLGPVSIEISDLAKTILLNGELEVAPSYLKKYEGSDSYSDSLLLEEDRVKAFFPVVEYHLRKVMRDFQIEMGDIQLSDGINGNYYLKTTIHQAPILLPISFQQEGMNYEIMIGNLFSNCIPLQMNLSFVKDGIRVLSSIPEYDYYDYFNYMLEGGIPFRQEEIEWNGKMIRFEKEHLTKVEDLPSNILPKEEFIHWYLLPWNGFLGVSEKKNSLTDQDSLLERHIYSIWRSNDNYFENEYSSKQYQRNQPSEVDFVKVVLDTFYKTNIGIKDGDYRLMETKFSDDGKTGFYQEKLANNHFYCISDALSWDHFDDHSCFLGRQDGVEDKADLLDSKIYAKRMSEHGII